MEDHVKYPSKEIHSSIHRQDADKCLVAMAMQREGGKRLLLVTERCQEEGDGGGGEIIMQAAGFFCRVGTNIFAKH